MAFDISIKKLHQSLEYLINQKGEKSPSVKALRLMIDIRERKIMGSDSQKDKQ